MRREAAGLAQLGGGIGLGIRGGQERAIPERVPGRAREHGGVHPAREGDHHALHLPEEADQPRVLRPPAPRPRDCLPLRSRSVPSPGSPVARLDLAGVRRLSRSSEKSSTVEGCHHRAVHHGGTEGVDVRHAQLGQIAHEAAREGIPRAGGVEDRLQRIGRREEEAAGADHERAVLPALDHHRLAGPCARMAARGLDQVGLAREHARLRVVDEEHVHARASSAPSASRLPLDPEVHGVERGEPGRCSICSSTSSCSLGIVSWRGRDTESSAAHRRESGPELRRAR